MIKQLGCDSQQDLVGIRVFDIINLGIDVIVKYCVENKKPDTIPIHNSFLTNYYGKNQEELLVNVLKHYISTTKNLQVLKIFEYKKHFYKLTDFDIQIIKKVEYDLREFVFVKIINKITGVIMKDWVKSDQIKSPFFINNLICWERSGREIVF
ncbi:MAG: hypothetical protein ACTSQG_04980 [Promethearchaeota archaeon]